MPRVLIALGSNMSSTFGSPLATLNWARAELHCTLAGMMCSSPVYASSPVGPGLQRIYVNAVLAGDVTVSPRVLLRLCQRLERQAGRRRRMRWTARPLDVDVIDYRGVVLHPRADQSVAATLVLPHPKVAERPFVLQPIRDIAPHWRHPVTGLTAAAMLARLPRRPEMTLASTERTHESV
ncbi:MAG: 2-amino-4-hydroxy-6-hydroxymethyldihydropteridine diphosphokinase [Pseudomonadota bacterium]